VEPGASPPLRGVFNQCGDESRLTKCGFVSEATLSVCEFIVDQSAQMISYRLMIEPLNHFV